MLATFVLSSEVTESNTIFNAVFFVVVVSAIVQGTTLERVAGRLGLLSPAPPAREAPLEVGPQSELELIDFAVADGPRDRRRVGARGRPPAERDHRRRRAAATTRSRLEGAP